MRAKQWLFAVTITSLAALLLACAPTDKNASDRTTLHVADQTPVSKIDPRPPPRPTPSDDFGHESNGDAHVDPVPGALERMKRWPGLGDAVTKLVMNSPKGRIHGHDAERIDIEVDDMKGKAEVLFVLPASFELHGDRRLACVNEDGLWRCTDKS